MLNEVIDSTLQHRIYHFKKRKMCSIFNPSLLLSNHPYNRSKSPSLSNISTI